jgi:ferredoxin-NADP reductase
LVIVADWRPARVVEVIAANGHARVLRVSVPQWPGNEPGQHVDIRLTAEDGYQAVRSYSLASYGPDDTIELGVDEVPDGEVSPYLVRDVQPGDEVEVKGPLGAYFVWRRGGEAPVQLVAGGSGVVPLIAMARARADAGGPPFRLLYSVRTPEDALYRDEVMRLAGQGIDVTWVYTRGGPSGWTGPIGRLDQAALSSATWPASDSPDVFVCGPTGFVEHVADELVQLGHPPLRVKTERFGGA